MNDYLEIQMTVHRGDLGDQGIIFGHRKLYPVDHAMDESYISFLTYETLDMLDKVRTVIKETP